MRNRIGGCLIGAIALFALAGCGSGGEKPPQANISASGDKGVGAAAPAAADSGAASTQSPDAASQEAEKSEKLVVVRTSLGDITIKLFPEKAPITVDNFLRNYVDTRAYTRTIFHHVDSGFMVAAGGFSEDLKPIPTRTPIHNEADNGLSNKRGTVAMARNPEFADSATSQFFINVVENTDLDHVPDDEKNYGYCVFGEVVKGLEVVDKIAKVQTKKAEGFDKMPAEPVVIASVERMVK